MDGDVPYRRLATALWVLARTVGLPGVSAEQTSAAAAAAEQALLSALAGENHFVLQERGGALFANGVRLRLDVEGFAAAEGLGALLRRCGIGELLLTPAARAADLLAWARCCNGSFAPDQDPQARLLQSGSDGVYAAGRAVPEVEPAAAAAAANSSSQLRSVFLQNQLMAAFAPSLPVPRRIAQSVLQAVAEALLGEAEGLQQLQHLQRDPPRLAAGVHAAVLSALLARAVGCDDPLVVSIAAAALLHDIGRLVDGGQPSPAVAGCRWLLANGGESEFWLRCALVARTHGEAAGSSLARATEVGLAAMIVRIAARADQLLRQEQQSPAAALLLLRQDSLLGSFPGELVTALAAVLPLEVAG